MRNDLYTMAVVKAESAGQFGPNEPEAYIWLARAYDWYGLYDKSFGFSQKAIQLAPNSATAFALQAEVKLDQNKLSDAERDARKAIQLDANSADGHRILGYILRENKQNQSSIIVEFGKAAQLEPNSTFQMRELGSMYRWANNLALAIPQFERSIALYSHNVRAYYNLGTIHLGQKQYDKAIDSYGAAIKLNDQVASLYRGLGQSYLGAGNLNAARDAAQKALALDPNTQDNK